MNTLEQPLRAGHEVLTVDEPRISRTASRTPRRALSLMPCENSEMDVPEGQMRIAQRFNAGMDATPGKVPKGRLKDGNDRFTFSRPFGTRMQSTIIPALKRRAIIVLSLRDRFPSNFRRALALARAKSL